MGKIEKTNAMRILDKQKIEYAVETYDSSDGALDGITVAGKIGQPVEFVYKTLVTQGKSKNYFVFVIPVADSLDLKKAAKAAGVKSIAMIPQKELLPLTGYIHGGCSPIGMKKKFKTVIDATAANFDTIIISGGRIGTQIFISPHDLRALVDAEFYDIIKEA